MAEQNEVIVTQAVDGQSQHPTMEDIDLRNGNSTTSGSESTYEIAKERTVTSVSNAIKNDSSNTNKLWKALKFDFIREILNASDEQPRPWKGALIRFGPLSGIFCLLLALVSIFASLAILAASNGQSTASWATPPSTYLAIFTAIANLSVRYSAMQGVIIAWWIRALRGSKLSKLHWDWRSGSSLRGALTAGPRMGLLGVGCILSTVVAVDGPLLQRASTVFTGPVARDPIPLDVVMAPEIPRGSTGTWVTKKQSDVSIVWSLAFNRTVPTPNGTASNEIWYASNEDLQIFVDGPLFRNGPLSGVIQGCPGSCEANLIAPALIATDCSSTEYPVDFTFQWDWNKVSNFEIAPPLDSDVFIIATNLVLGEREVVNVITEYATVSDCEGKANLTVCTFESAIGEYNVQIQDNKILMDRITPPKLIAFANNTAVNYTFDENKVGQLSTLAVIPLVLYQSWSAVVSNSPETEIRAGSITSEIYELPSNTKCHSYRDAHEDLTQSINKLMLAIGAYMGQQSPSYLEPLMDTQLPVRTTINGYPTGEQSTFNTNYWYFLAAAIVELVCVALIASTYWGWWKIGREVSLSPLEMAKAFESPMLEDCDSNSTGRDLAKAVGDYTVRYGILNGSQENAKTKLGFGEPTSVSSPGKHMRFDA